jgi:hypothetical protein
MIEKSYFLYPITIAQTGYGFKMPGIMGYQDKIMDFTESGR